MELLHSPTNSLDIKELYFTYRQLCWEAICYVATHSSLPWSQPKRCSLGRRIWQSPCSNSITPRIYTYWQFWCILVSSSDYARQWLWHGMICEGVHICLEGVLILLVKQEGEFWRQCLFSLNWTAHKGWMWWLWDDRSWKGRALPALLCWGTMLSSSDKHPGWLLADLRQNLIQYFLHLFET